MKIEIINWIKNWYLDQCNDDWEHSYGITIQTIDNPGWEVNIDLKGTKYEGLVHKSQLIEKNDADWYSFKIEDNKFSGYGDPSKLDLILIKFKELVERYKA